MTFDELKACGRLVTEVEAAEAIGVSRRTMQKWRQRGEGPRYRKLGGAKTDPVRYEPREVLSFAPEVSHEPEER